MSFMERFVDERFLMHRLRSSSVAGMAGAVAAAGLFLYRLYIDHLIEWDVFAVLAVIALIKISMMIYYRFRG